MRYKISNELVQSRSFQMKNRKWYVYPQLNPLAKNRFTQIKLYHATIYILFIYFFLKKLCHRTFLSVVILPSSSPSTSASQTKSTPLTTSSSTVPSTSVQPTTLSPTECRPNTCKNGGTCVVPGYFCVCTKYYVWNLCAVYVGKCVDGWIRM